MLQLDFTIFPVLQTDRLILKEITDRDAQNLYNMRSNPEIMKYVDRPVPNNLNEILELIEKMRVMKTKGEGISWGIFKKENPDVKIGNIGLFRIIAEHYRAEIGYMLQQEEQQKGIMFEAMQAVIHYCFNVMKLHSMEANINPENIASQKLLEKAGFVREAYFRENYYFNGRFIDSAIYSLLKNDIRDY